MNLRKLAAGFAAAAALSAASLEASAVTGPYYTCIRTALTNFNGTVVDAAVATPELSTLVSLVTTAGLGNALATTPNITVFAPTNAAFDKVDPAVLGAIGGNTALLTTVLTYHVTASVQDPRRWTVPQTRTTLAEQQIYIYHDGKTPRVNGANANCRGVRTSNGIVWLIDSVLLPQF